MENKKIVKCPKCLYYWETKSKKFYITCPNCRYPVKIGEKKHE